MELRKSIKREGRGVLNYSAPSLLLKAAMVQSDKAGNASPSPTSVLEPPVPAAQGKAINAVPISKQSRTINGNGYRRTFAPVNPGQSGQNSNGMMRSSAPMMPPAPIMHHQQHVASSSIPAPHSQVFGTPQPANVTHHQYPPSYVNVNSQIPNVHHSSPAFIAPRPVTHGNPIGVRTNTGRPLNISKPSSQSRNPLITSGKVASSELSVMFNALEKYFEHQVRTLKEDHRAELQDLRAHFDTQFGLLTQALGAREVSTGSRNSGGILPDQTPGACHFTVHAGGVITIGSPDEKGTSHAIKDRVAAAEERYKLTRIGNFKSDTSSSTESDIDDQEPQHSSVTAPAAGPSTSTADGHHQHDNIVASEPSVMDNRVPKLRLPLQQQESPVDDATPQSVLGKRRSPPPSLRSSKRKRDNWTDGENLNFMKVVISNSELEEMELRRLLAKTFSPRRTHEQCANHLRILRAQGKLPQAKDEAQKSS